MTNDEIKTTCELLYSQIKSAKRQLAELREECPHDETFEGQWEWAAGHTVPAHICSYCGTFIRELAENPLIIQSYDQH